MITDRQQHELVTAYLARLREAATRRLPADRAAELVEDIRAHLQEALPPGASEAEVRTALDRVGAPSDLVDEAGGSPAPAAAPAPPESNRREVAALACLVASLVLFIVVPLAAVLLVAGLVLLLISHRWSAVDKALGMVAYAVLGAPALLLAGAAVTFTTYTEVCTQATNAAEETASAPSCTSTGGYLPPWLLISIAVAWFAVQVYVAIRLARRARVASA